MFRQGQSGFHTKLTDEVKALVISNVKGNYSCNQVARMCKIGGTTLSGWLRRGRDDVASGQETIFAQLLLEFELERGKEIKEMLGVVRKRKDRWQAVWELIKTVAKDEFGVDSADMKAVEELISSLMNRVEKMEKSHGA